MSLTFILYGAGGGYREISFIIRRASPGSTIAGAVVTHPERETHKDFILGGEDSIISGSSVVLAMGTPSARLNIGRRLSERGILLPSIIDPSVIIDGSNRIGEGVVISPGTIFTVNADVGVYSWICAGVLFGHDSVLGQGSVVFPGAIISGGVHIGSGTMVGAGSRILPNLIIGDNVRIGAGAVITKDVPNGKTVVGIPGQVR